VIKDANGLEIARLKEKIGTVEVVEPQETISIVKSLSGGKFAEHDLASLDLQARMKRAMARSGGALPGGRDARDGAAGKRATIAVGLVRVNLTARTNGLADGHVKRITDDLILKLGKTNRFVVLERQEVDQVFDEKTFDAMMQGEDMRSRLQELAGADYLVHGEITNFYTQRREEKIPYVSELKVTVTGTGEGMLRIVDVHSGAIVAADKIRVVVDVQNEADTTMVMSNFIDRFTTDSVGLILERLYPVKVLAVTNDGSIYINRGSDAGLQAGMVFDVMRPGMELKDPDTGLSFGRAESKVATVEVTLVEQSRSTTRMVAGETPQSGDILHATVVVKEKPKVKVNTPAW
jgi:TolB-like protein